MTSIKEVIVEIETVSTVSSVFTPAETVVSERGMAGLLAHALSSDKKVPYPQFGSVILWEEESLEENEVHRHLFKEPLSERPGLAIAISTIRFKKETRLRIFSSATNIQRESFDLQVQSMKPSGVYGVTVKYLQLLGIHDSIGFQNGEFQLREIAGSVDSTITFHSESTGGINIAGFRKTITFPDHTNRRRKWCYGFLDWKLTPIMTIL